MTFENPVIDTHGLDVAKDKIVEDVKTQVTTLPSPTLANLGKVYQYIGSDDTIYTPNYFYKCVDNDGTYAWINVPVGESGSGSSELTADLNVTKTVGGIQAGHTYDAGTDFETMWRDMLNPVENPVLTPPSATLTVSGNKVLETGSQTEKTFIINFDRGSINPAYGTSGKRSGVAVEYTLNGASGQSGNQFVQTVSASNNSFVGMVYYESGEQPKNSAGENYSTPLPSGSISTNTITYEFVDAIWSNAADNSVIAKEPLISKSVKTKIFEFAPQTASSPETFDIPVDLGTVDKVEVLNELSGKYESCINEFTVSNTTHNNAGGEAVNYKRYVDSRGYASGSRTIKITLS